MSKRIKNINKLLISAICAAFFLPPPALAQFPGTSADKDRVLDLAPDSPYRDPDIIYLEADELINDDAAGILTARGEVEGKYQDRILRADEVVYTLRNGKVIATGNVVLIDSTGATQYAEKLDLSDELEAGTATGFTSRFPDGGIMGAAFATRRSDKGIELYKAYYTACEACKGDKPTWQLKARRVSQDREKNMIRYKDAVFQFLGVPFFYTPYLAHPDPTAGRASGWLSPFFGVSASKGFNAQAPYYLALDPYSELTLTPRVFQKVNPIMEYQYRRKFHSGEVNVEGSFTYASAFDRDGRSFDRDRDTFILPNGQDNDAPFGKRLRSHVFATGLFDISDNWKWGFGAQGASDDLYLNRYDLVERPEKFGLYSGDGRRLVSQIFAVGQDDSFRFSSSAYGFQSLRTSISADDDIDNLYRIRREDDSTLPVLAPKIEFSKYITDPLVEGRLRTFGDVALLTRKVGTDYTRATAGLDWEKTFITPGGIEAKPFAEARFDHFNITPDDADEVEFSRTIGQAGLDVRWPFIKAGDKVSFIVEPRAQLTQNFGDGKVSNFSSTNTNDNDLFEDSLDIDLDQSLFWAQNKSTGYDFWQKGFRADVGGALTALWGESRTSLFVGRSFARDFDDDFGITSGLSGRTSDLVGLYELNLNNKFNFTTRVRYDDDENKFRRLDTGFSYRSGRFRTNWRYYKIDAATLALATDPTIPPEEISGSFSLGLTDDWSIRYSANRDIDKDLTRRQEIALAYIDDCTKIEFVYTERNFSDDIVRDSKGIGIRVSLLTLGDFEPE